MSMSDIARGGDTVKKAQAINGEISSGDWVYATVAPPYSYLVGQVTDIVPPGAPDRETENETDDVHVNFMDAGYSDERKAEILDTMNSIRHSRGNNINAFALDDVIMSPDDLIRITDIDRDKFTELLESSAAGPTFYKEIMDAVVISKETELIERFDKNLADYHASLEGFTTRELIGMADEIAATNDMHKYMTQRHGMDYGELEFFLQFQNPLEVVADAWHCYADDIEDMSYVVYDIYDKQDALADYPLMKDIAPDIDAAFIDDDGKRRFMGVDLVSFLGKIADRVIVHHPKDWKTDVEQLYKAASSDNPEDKRLMWHVSGWGTHLKQERETFIRDTGAFSTWVDYPRMDSDTFGYAVEITGRKGHAIIGNVFDLGHYPAHAMHVREEALVLEMVTLTYADSWGVNAGKTITVPRFEYDDDRHRLMSESGNVVKIEYHPYEGVREMSGLLRSERAARMAYPIGSMEAHLRQLDGILADERTPPEKTPADKKPSIGEKLRAGKEKADASRVQNAAASTKDRGEVR